MNTHVVTRDYFPGIGEAVADRTVNRKIFTEEQRAALPDVLELNPQDPLYAEWKNAAELSEWPTKDNEHCLPKFKGPELRTETWGDVAERVSRGNTQLIDNAVGDMDPMRKLMAKGALLMSGRHLQHTDGNLKFRPMEVVTNCSSSASTFMLFYLLLNGSGVGRAYDDDMMIVDWRNMPDVSVVVDADYPDRQKTKVVWDAEAQAMVEAPMIGEEFMSFDHVQDLLLESGTKVYEDIETFFVPDSRGGWAQALELLERMTYEGKKDHLLILDFSEVRANGSPIRGMQNRPSSGPGPLMEAIDAMAKVKNMGLEPWEASMWMDHYAAECVLVGGARRAARMATKTWRDKNVFGFIEFKRKNGLWTSNNSVTIDDEFRERCKRVANLVGIVIREGGPNGPDDMIRAADFLWSKGEIDHKDFHAFKVLIKIADASYHDGTGEPGIINQDRLVANDEGIEEYVDGLYAGSKGFQIDENTIPMMRDIAKRVIGAKYTMITNPCGEITLLMLGAYCVIADVVPFHADDLDEAEQAFRMATRALIRTNFMDCMYQREVKRTNRIGVGITGFHEWALSHFDYEWSDIIDEQRSIYMWQALSRFKRAIVDEAQKYSKELGVVAPHTDTTFKPAGTTSKLFGLTEGAHLPSMAWYLRWVQFRDGDPLIEEYRAKGYPVRKLGVSYADTTIVGFPTAPAICGLVGEGQKITTAGEATPEEQYEFLRLLEKYWIVGVDEEGNPLENTGNQISYTLKYKPELVDFPHFLHSLIEGQFSIRCCSVMPQQDGTAYEYQPEEPITEERYNELMEAIDFGFIKEDIGFEHVDCGAGGCPISFDEDDKTVEDRMI